MVGPYSGGTSIPIYDEYGEGLAGNGASGIDLSGLSGLATSSNVAAAGYGLEGFASLAQGIAAAQRAKKLAAYNAEVAGNNAQAEAWAAENQAQQYIRRAAMARQQQLDDEQIAQNALAYREARQHEQNEYILGQTRAIVGNSGLMMSGSPMAVFEETVRQQELDTLAGRYQLALQIRQGRQQSQEQTTQDEYAAEMLRFGAGERLRIGKQQGQLIQSQADTSGVAAGINRAGASLLKGYNTYNYMQERRANATLLS